MHRAPPEHAQGEDQGADSDPAKLALWRTARADAVGGPDCARGGLRAGVARGPSSHRRSRSSRRRCLTGSVICPVLGVLNHGPSSLLTSPLSAAQAWNGTSANDNTKAPSTP